MISDKTYAKRCLALLISALMALAAPAAASTTTADVPVVAEALSRRYGVTGPVKATPTTVQGLSDLLALQRTVYPYAEVTGRFHDWRGVSRYRRSAGLHLGYDIAMPAGTPVRAGWAGSVVSIAPWSDREWGITVSSSSGIETTYGHLSPGVGVGNVVEAGDVVGTVVVDHVDVKMRDASGNCVDFGGDGAVPASVGPLLGDSREARMVAWLVARRSVELAEEELENWKRERAAASIQCLQLERRVAELSATVPRMARYVEEGLMARVEADKARADLAEDRKKLACLKSRQQNSTSTLAALESRVKMARTRLSGAERQAREQGMTWSHVVAFVNGTVASDSKLSQEVVVFKRSRTTGRHERLTRLRQEVENGRQTMLDMEALYEAGGLSRRDLEAARERHEAYETELKSLVALPQDQESPALQESRAASDQYYTRPPAR